MVNVKESFSDVCVDGHNYYSLLTTVVLFLFFQFSCVKIKNSALFIQKISSF